MRRGRYRSRVQVPQIPESVPDAGVSFRPGEPMAPRRVLDFQRTPEASYSEGVGQPGDERDPWFETTPGPGPSAGVGVPAPEQWVAPGMVPAPGNPFAGPPLPDLPINPRDETRVVVPDASWMRARDLPFEASAFPIGRLVPILNIKDGPGWVDVRSPQITGVRWHLRGVEDIISQDLVVTTGPAGFVSIWVGELGTQVLVEMMANSHAYNIGTDTYVDQADGHFVTGIIPDSETKFQVRYHSADAPTSGGGSIQSRSLNSMPLLPMAVGPVLFPIGYPPLGREAFIAHCDGNCVFTLNQGTPAAPVTLWSSGGTMQIAIDVPADTWVGVMRQGGAGITQVLAHWRDLSSFTQVG